MAFPGCALQDCRGQARTLLGTPACLQTVIHPSTYVCGLGGVPAVGDRPGLASLSSAWGHSAGSICVACSYVPAEAGLTWAWAWCSVHCWTLIPPGPCRLPDFFGGEPERTGEPPQDPTSCCVCRRPPSCPMAPMMAALWSSLQGSSCCYRRCSRNCGMKGTVCSSSPR